jgi:jumonji domain-containing protein 7
MVVSSWNTSLFTEDVETDIPWATKALNSKPKAVNLWIGNKRATTSFLKDHYEDLYVVVSREKHFLLLPQTC